MNTIKAIGGWASEAVMLYAFALEEEMLEAWGKEGFGARSQKKPEAPQAQTEVAQESPLEEEVEEVGEERGEERDEQGIEPAAEELRQANCRQKSR